MVKFIEKLKLENNRSIYLIRGLKEEGKDIYMYIEMNKTQVDCLGRDNKKGLQKPIEEYGEVIEKGYGKKPNSQVRKRLKNEYGWVE